MKKKLPLLVFLLFGMLLNAQTTINESSIDQTNANTI